MTSFRVVSAPDAAYKFIASKYPLWRTDDWRGIIQLRNNKVIAAVGYDQYNGQNLFMHVASDGSRRWLTRHGLYETFKYPFVTLECARVSVWVEADNKDSRGFVTNLGFTAEAVLHKAGRGGVDVLIYRMFRQECRYA